MTKTEIIRIDLSKQFIKQYDRAPIKVRKAFDLRLKVFIKDSNNKILHNHALQGKYKGYRSINVTGDWRAIFRVIQGYRVFYFDQLGTHSQLYK